MIEISSQNVCVPLNIHLDLCFNVFFDVDFIEMSTAMRTSNGNDQFRKLEAEETSTP
jgi:hypothetical protein